jgi:signal transduction histidine kinase
VATPSPAAPLTRIGFRRDVRLFLFLLAGFFAALVILLLLFLRMSLGQMEEVVRAHLNAAADAAVTDIRSVLRNHADVDAQLLAITAHSGFAGMEIALKDGQRHTLGFTGEDLEPIERDLGFGTAKLYFDPATFQSVHRRCGAIASISIAATLMVMVLLFLYVRRILRPIDAMLDDAGALGERDHGVDEASYLIATFRNSIATLRAQEAELKALHEKEKTRANDLQTISATLTRSLSSGLIVIGNDHRIVEMNAAARAMLNVDAAAPISGSIGEVVGENMFSEVIAGALASGEAVSRREIEIPPTTIGLTTVPLYSESSRFLGTLVLFTDLSQVRRLESRVREMQMLADLGEMSAGIAHEFRNSLSTILGLLKLAGRMQPKPEVEAKLNAAVAEANQLAKAVDSLLQFARPMQPEREPVDLRELLGQLAKQTEQLYPEVPIEVDGEPAVIHGDSSLLSRAFDNILRNAVEATLGSNGNDPVIVHVAGGVHPTVSVTNGGAPLAEEEAAKVFVPFYSTKPSGMGIGLPLARKIVLLHGGTLRFESRPETGTTVRAEFDTTE